MIFKRAQIFKIKASRQTRRKNAKRTALAAVQKERTNNHLITFLLYKSIKTKTNDSKNKHCVHISTRRKQHAKITNQRAGKAKKEKFKDLSA
mgnify:CR=1 FL=1